MNHTIITEQIATYGTETLIINGRKRFCYLLKCTHCNLLYFKAEYELMRGIRKNTTFFCSRECRGNFYSITKEICCANCHKLSTKKPSQMSKNTSGNFFCNSSCAATYNNSKHPKRIKKPKPIKIKMSKPNKRSKIYNCLICSVILSTKRNYCDQCRPAIISAKAKKYWEEQYIKHIIDWQSGKIMGNKGEGQVTCFIRKYLFDKYNSKCSECGWAKINPVTNKIPLEIDHIDGDWNNHKENNL